MGAGYQSYRAKMRDVFDDGIETSLKGFELAEMANACADPLGPFGKVVMYSFAGVSTPVLAVLGGLEIIGKTAVVSVKHLGQLIKGDIRK